MKIGKNRIIALIMIVFGLLVIWQTGQIKATFAVSTKDTGPKLFPYFAAGCLVLCSIGKFIAAKEDEKYVWFFDKTGWIRVLTALLMFVAYVLALKYIGFLISTPLMLFGRVKLIAGKKPIRYPVTVIFCIAVTAVIYLVFNVLMHIMLPKGIIL